MSAQDDTQAPVRTGLTATQFRVLGYIAQGLTHAAIGTEMRLSTDSIKAHATAMYRRLAARNAAHAVHIAYQRGILKRGQD